MISVMKRLIKKSERYRRRGRVVRATLNRVTGNEWTYCNSWPARARARACVRMSVPEYVSRRALSGRFFYREVERPADRAFAIRRDSPRLRHVNSAVLKAERQWRRCSRQLRRSGKRGELEEPARRTRKKRIDSRDEATMRRQKGRDKMIVIRNQRDRALIGSIVGTMPQRRWPGPEEPSNYYLFPFDASRPLGLSPRNAPITLLPRFLLAAREASKLLSSRDARNRVIACAGDRRSAIGECQTNTDASVGIVTQLARSRAC